MNTTSDDSKYYSSNQNLGKNIQKVLDRKGWSQVQLAEELDVHKTHVNKWIRNRVRPSSSYIDLIATKMGVSPFEILTGEIKEPGTEIKKCLPAHIMEAEMKSLVSLLNNMIEAEDKDDQVQIRDLIISKVELLINM